MNAFFFRNGKRVTITKTTVSKPDGSTDVHEVVEDQSGVSEKKIFNWGRRLYLLIYLIY